MKNPRLYLLVGMIAIATNIAVASAQTREPAAKPAAEQSGQAEKLSPMAKVRTWTKARWDAAREHWEQDNARFYACNGKWREQTEGRKFSLHDQREFLFQCMSRT